MSSYKNTDINLLNIPFKQKGSVFDGYDLSVGGSFKTFLWNTVVNYPETF